MDQGATLLGQSVFDCVHRVPLVSPVLARLSGTALKVRAGSFSSDHNLAHYIAYAALFDEAGGASRRKSDVNGTKRTFRRAQPMSAFGGKADIAFLRPNVCL